MRRLVCFLRGHAWATVNNAGRLTYRGCVRCGHQDVDTN